MTETSIENFIPFYPDLSDDDFFMKIYNKKEFIDLALEAEYSKDCKENNDSLDHQLFISRLLSSYSLYDKLLLFHDMGTGKSGVAFTLSERLLSENFGINNIFVFTNSKDVLNNLKTELIFKRTRGKYIPDNFNKLTKTQQTIAINKVLDDNNYTFDQFYYLALDIKKTRLLRNGDDILKKKYSNSLLIFDEIHNIRVKTKQAEELNKYEEIMYLLGIITNHKVLLMTGTPMRDNPNEITSILNLILDDDKKFTKLGMKNIFSHFDIKYMKNNKMLNNISDFKDKIKGKISYLKSEQLKTRKKFMGQEYGNFVLTTTKLQGEQEEVYKEIYKSETAQSIDIDTIEDKQGLYPKSRQSILCVYPDKTTGDASFKKYIKTIDKSTYIHYEFQKDMDNEFGKLEDLKKFSIKFYTIIKKLQENDSMCHFVYCKFLNGSGLALLSLLLEKYLNFSRYKGGVINTEKDRYILLSGDIKSRMKLNLINEFNKERNAKGKFIRCILGTDVIKEGLSFFNIQRVHILNPHWNFSETDQIIARAFRFNSHKYLPEDIIVQVYLYISKFSNTNEGSIDLVMYKRSEIKDIGIKSVEKILKENAIDCQLFKKRNERDRFFDYTRECEYEVCEYKCEGIDLNKVQIDSDTYNIYYNNEELKDTIILLYKKYFYLKLQDLIIFFNKNTLYDILYIFYNLINNQISIYNKYGIRSYIKQDKDIFYLVNEVDDRKGMYLNYYYNEHVTNSIQKELFNQEYILENLKKDLTPTSKKVLLLNNLSIDTQFTLLTQSLILPNKTSPIIEFILNYYYHKYSDIMYKNEKYIVCTLLKDFYCYKNTSWIKCPLQILKLYENIENKIIQNTRDNNLTFYGIIKNNIKKDNQYKNDIFYLKEIPPIETRVESFDELKTLCDKKNKFKCVLENITIKDLVCRKKDRQEDKIILRNESTTCEFNKTNFSKIKVNGENQVKIEKLLIQIDSRLVKDGKECVNFDKQKLVTIVEGKINLLIEESTIDMCKKIRQYYKENNLILYEKYSDNLNI